MRPIELSPLFSCIASLPGVGPKTQERLHKMGISRVWHLLQRFPQKCEHRHLVDRITPALDGQKITCTVTVQAYQHPHRRQHPFKVLCDIEGETLTVLFFHARGPYIQQQLPVGATRLISGILTHQYGAYQMVHPDFMGHLTEKESWIGAMPLYGLTAGLSQTHYRKLVQHALKKVPALPEWLPSEFCAAYNWASWKQALTEVHHPQSEYDLEDHSPLRARLAFDELLAHQLILKALRDTVRERPGKQFKASETLGPLCKKYLPFFLTEGQQKVLQLISEELASPQTMMRLLQGDVGSGKTIVALLAALQVIEGGGQVALLAPTELLSEQHDRTLGTFLKDLPVKWALLTGKTPVSEKRALKQKLSEGAIHLILGTHALMEGDVQFQNLGLVVIDEQHRFGVKQRQSLIQKGEGVNLLVMSATPIPRSLALTAFGDLESCHLTEKPQGRRPVKTSVLSLNKIQDLYVHLNKALGRGEKAYWVCPLIEESEALDLGHAQARYESLKNAFPGQVGLLHGRMKADEKAAVMADFMAGIHKILVSTTVIEVGVDVKDATIMLIEHAERFGLAQLHQLRGRVGRGDQQSSCVLLYGKALSTVGKRRLQLMCETNDGFQIAEADLQLRGPGDVLGTKQSGLPIFQMANLETQSDLLMMAHQLAQSLSKTKADTPSLLFLKHLFPTYFEDGNIS